MKSGMRTMVAVAVAVVLTDVARAVEGNPSNDEIAKELANPNTALTSLKLQNQYVAFGGDLDGADDLDMFRLFLQPTLPFPLDNGYTLWVRPGLPVILEQPVFDRNGGRLEDESGLGDITLDVQYGTTLESGFLWSVGVSTAFPTASPEELGSGAWTLGPGFQLGRVTEKVIFGGFVNHQWDVEGDAEASPEQTYLRRASDDSIDISLSVIQLFAVHIPGGGWTYGSTPIISYDHEAEEWLVPLHLTVGKTVILKERPWDFSIDLNYYVERPDAIGTEWMIGFNVSPVVENVFATLFD